MYIEIKTKDKELHTFSSSADETEPLHQYKMDKEAHVFWIRTVKAEYIFPLENTLWIRREKDA